VSKAQESVPILAFDRDGYPYAFLSLEEACGELEAIDVVAGEYEAFTLDGRRVRAWGDERRGEVHLEVTDLRELDRLRALVGEAHDRLGFTSDREQPVAVANELLARQWNERWPRWPSWLHRRTHRGAPPQVDNAT
jgi:hypothetical protein